MQDVEQAVTAPENEPDSEAETPPEPDPIKQDVETPEYVDPAESEAQQDGDFGEDYSEQETVIAEAVQEPAVTADASTTLKAVIEAAIYITDEPLTLDQIATAVSQPLERVKQVLEQLAEEYAAPDCGLSIRELAGGYKMSTKPEYHESIRAFVKRLQPALKLSLAALETLAVVAYKQPITGPEIMDIRGVQGAGVLKTLLDRKLVASAGRKNVLGKPMMYKTTREFLIQFGLSSLAELPTLKEFEELGRLALTGSEENAAPVEMERASGAALQERLGSSEENAAQDVLGSEPQDETQVELRNLADLKSSIERDKATEEHG